MSLLEERLVYKPFKYPWAYEAWLKQQRIHWLPEEVPLAEDVKDWEKNLTAPEKNLLTQIFRFFVLKWFQFHRKHLEIRRLQTFDFLAP